MRDIRVAYIDWQLAAERAELAEQGSRLRNDIARISEARLAAGAVAELDVSAMRLDAMFAMGEAVRAVRDAELAHERLRFVLGIQLTDRIVLKPEQWQFFAETSLDVDQLVHETITSRPDLRAMQWAVCAAERRADLARRDYWIIEGFLPDINGHGSKGFEAGPGLNFRLPVFHQNQGAIARAEADAERLRRQYANLRDTAAMEVRSAHIQLLLARQDEVIWRSRVVPQAVQAMTIARQALEEDGVSLLLVLETTRQLITAQLRQLEAEAQLRRAMAELERSVGRRLTDDPDSEPTGGEIQPTPAVELREIAQ